METKRVALFGVLALSGLAVAQHQAQQPTEPLRAAAIERPAELARRSDPATDRPAIGFAKELVGHLSPEQFELLEDIVAAHKAAGGARFQRIPAPPDQLKEREGPEI